MHKVGRYLGRAHKAANVCSRWRHWHCGNVILHLAGCAGRCWWAPGVLSKAPADYKYKGINYPQRHPSYWRGWMDGLIDCGAWKNICCKRKKQLLSLYLLETIDDMRAYISHVHISSQDESSTIDRSDRGANFCLRYKQHEIASHHRNEPKPGRWASYTRERNVLHN